MPLDPPVPSSGRFTSLTEAITGTVDEHEAELVELRRDVHAHPELSWAEERTTELVQRRLEKAGWRITPMPGTGLLADLGDRGTRVALRADLDALPVPDETDDPWRSTVPGVAHGCGHDVHVAALVGAGLALARAEEAHGLGGRVRLIFQPAEEVVPGGAIRMMSAGAVDDAERIFALHCDPSIDAGQVGLRLGPLTSAADLLEVRLEGSGGHTSRPHLTGDLTYALAKVVTELPAVVSRRMDPRAGVSVVWGKIHAGSAFNVIPGTGVASGTVRILDAVAWSEAEDVVREVIQDLVRPYGVTAHIDYERGVPPVVNEPVAHRILHQAVLSILGERGHVVAPQSLGGEDFGWYLDQIPGAMFRLGIRTPGGPTYDLHQGDLRVDERAVAVGAKVLAGAAVGALALR
ncbi:amidohydrolase [Nocardioides insulae]|uniref:amidohydrolase n=1 Tax=Nocardioides insulae TaxID=394734 RepID=UPI0003F5336A|nr:amidohydrolase [Nocardioides insulae]